MNNARIERMIREVSAEPAAQFFDLLVSQLRGLWPAVAVPTPKDAVPSPVRLLAQ